MGEPCDRHSQATSYAKSVTASRKNEKAAGSSFSSCGRGFSRKSGRGRGAFCESEERMSFKLPECEVLLVGNTAGLFWYDPARLNMVGLG